MDISAVWDDTVGSVDWLFVAPDLVNGNDLVTSVIISLFSDASAADDDTIPDGTTDRRGWYGDLDEAFAIGSRLWLLDRAKQTPETLQRARDYITEALAWMIADGVAGSIDVYCEWTYKGVLGSRITLHRPPGGQYQSKWAGIGQTLTLSGSLLASGQTLSSGNWVVS
jgi:phage gp46-like protein